jgi:hypothetical protein
MANTAGRRGSRAGARLGLGHSHALHIHLQPYTTPLALTHTWPTQQADEAVVQVGEQSVRVCNLRILVGVAWWGFAVMGMTACKRGW